MDWAREWLQGKRIVNIQRNKVFHIILMISLLLRDCDAGHIFGLRTNISFPCAKIIVQSNPQPLPSFIVKFIGWKYQKKIVEYMQGT